MKVAIPLFILVALSLLTPQNRGVRAHRTASPEHIEYWIEKLRQVLPADSSCQATVTHETVHRLTRSPAHRKVGSVMVFSNGALRLAYPRSTIVSDGTVVRALDRDQNTVVVAKLTSDPLAQVAVLLLGDRSATALEASFHVRHVGATKGSGDAILHVFELVPRVRGHFIERILVTFDDGPFPLARLVLLDNAHNAVRLSFSQRKPGPRFHKKHLQLDTNEHTRLIRP